MRLDHVSYVTSHDQLADTVQRLGALIGSPFIDGGFHPRFGTRNFTCALKNNQYIEVVCPLDHPATEETPWGKAVATKAREGGGWFTWVFSTEDLGPIEEKFGRLATEGHRTRPNGSDLKWRQIGVRDIADNRALPFYIEWLSTDHPSQDGAPLSRIEKIVIADNHKLTNSSFKKEILASLDYVSIQWVDLSVNYDQPGIVSVYLTTPGGLVNLD